MVLHRHTFFLILFALLIVPPVAYKVFWLAGSKKAEGVFYMKQQGNALDQFRASNSLIWFMNGKDTVWFEEPGYLNSKEGEKVAVRFQKSDPSDAKVDTFRIIWGGTVIYGGIPVLILLVLFLHPHVIPYHVRMRFTRKKPFIQLLNPDGSVWYEEASYFWRDA